MPLIILLILLIVLMFWLDGRLVFRFLYLAVNLWLLVMYLTITELQTTNIPQVPWFETTPVSDTVKIYLSILLSVAGIILYFVSRSLHLSRTSAFFPMIVALEMLISLPIPTSETKSIIGAVICLSIMIAHLICFGLNSRRLFRR